MVYRIPQRRDPTTPNFIRHADASFAEEHANTSISALELQAAFEAAGPNKYGYLVMYRHSLYFTNSPDPLCSSTDTDEISSLLVNDAGYPIEPMGDFLNKFIFVDGNIPTRILDKLRVEQPFRQIQEWDDLIRISLISGGPIEDASDQETLWKVVIVGFCPGRDVLSHNLFICNNDKVPECRKAFLAIAECSAHQTSPDH
ncbi:hypothetical protein BDN70DRAFT_930459 [Pholiota conissans]|uniref:Uncharacterized protein n=1 Tax=Pholiota conissans TaxID=109636 RepID=A0A9P5Z7A0_9AGAR|nr:hypothetical protein BDN70DRAFT_930459 [Pholiota conissans]